MSKSLSVPISSWWPVRYYLQVICTAQHFTVHCTNNNWCRCLHLLFYTSHCNLTIRLYVACKKMKHCPRIRVVICATSTYLFTSHWMLVTSFWLWRKMISPLQSSEALWQQAETTGLPLLCTLYSLITTRLVSIENFLNARHHVLIEDAHCWNEWRRNSSAEHLAMSCSLCTKGKYSRSCWKAPLMH